MTTPTTSACSAPESHSGRPSGDGENGRSARSLDAVAVTLLAVVVVGLGVWTPSLSWDEGATVSAASRPWPDLLRLVHDVDAVHLAWYAVMHCWFDLVGYSPVTLRVPAVLCVGLTAGLTTVLGRSLLGRTGGLAAGLVFCLLPRVTAMGIDGRSNAASALLAAALTLVFVAATRARVATPTERQRRHSDVALWTVYALAASIAVVVFVYDALVVVAHAVALLVVTARDTDRARARRTLIGFGVAAGGSAVVCAPFVLVAARQVGQISWLHAPSLGTAKQVLVEQWFVGNPPFAALGLLLIVAGVVRTWRRDRATGVLLVSWLVVPLVMLLAVSVTWTPVYQARYLCSGTPAVALLAVAAVRGRPAPWTAVVLAAAVALSASSYAEQRTEGAKGTDWSRLAQRTDVASAHRTDSAAVLFGDVLGDDDSTLDVVTTAYPQAFSGAEDCRAGRSAVSRGALWPARRPLPRAIRCALDHREVWVVTGPDGRAWRKQVLRSLRGAGYRVDHRDDRGLTDLVHLVRPGPQR